MAPIQRVALAGKGRIGTPVAFALVKAGFATTILTRSASSITAVPEGAKIKEVDYDSDDSLLEALQDQDAVVSTVAMSGVLNQKRMIDAAVAAGVRHYIPAEYTIASRDPQAQWLPMYSTILDIQSYLRSKDGVIDWTVINCSALLEFCFDYPYVLDFDNRKATFYDSGTSDVSFSTFSTIAQAVVAVLQNPDRIQDHGVRVQGAVMPHKDVLEMAQRYSGTPWTTETRDAEKDISAALKKLKSGEAVGAEMMRALLTIMAAATFGDGYFEGVYSDPDNKWLGVGSIERSEVEEAIRKRIEIGTMSVQNGAEGEEGLLDVAAELVTKHR